MPAPRVKESILSRLALVTGNARRLAARPAAELALGAAENGLSGLSGLLTSAVAGPVAAVGAFQTGDYRDYSPLFQAIMERGTYSPRTPAGREIAGVANNAQAAYSEAIRRDVENIPVDMPITRTVARTAGEFAPAAVPAIKPAVTRMVSMPPTSARMRQAGIVNYHGTPHTVDRFSTDRIGTGEGVQAYGHGLYFADDAAVAQQYADALSTSRTTLDGVPVTPANPDFSAIMSIAARGYKQALADAKAQLASGFVDPEYQARQIAAIERIGPKARIKQEKVANVYTVDIPDEHIARMLDWDKPLSEQPLEVRNAFARAYRTYFGKKPEFSPDSLTGAQAYDMLAGGATGMHGYADIAAKTSALLNQHGIPGIRYLDQGSRGAGTGTRNTVLFDDSLVTITHENGQPRRRPGS